MSVLLDAATTERLPSHQQVVGPARVSAPTPSGSRWFVVATYNQAERRAAKNLADQHYQVYLPLILARRRDRVLRSQFHTVEIPLFPSYAFIRLDPRDPWRPVNNTPGVYRLVANADGMPQPIRPGVLEAVRATEAARRCPTAENAQWAPGVPCSLATGHPFEGHQAVVVQVGKEMATIALMMFGELREVAVQLDCLRPRDE